MKWGSNQWRRGVLRLYRSILVTHRVVLNEQQRLLGDRVVKQEFHAHMNVTDERVATEFIRSWLEYVDVLRKGRLPKIDMSLFSDKQLHKIAEMRKKLVVPEGNE
eukprot:PhF_6_TR1818/c0_g1_i1/m.2945